MMEVPLPEQGSVTPGHLGRGAGSEVRRHPVQLGSSIMTPPPLDEDRFETILVLWDQTTT